MNPDLTLLGLTAVVTGSTQGIGRAIACELARAGADVLVHGRNRGAAAEETAAEIRRIGRQSTVQLADIGRSRDRQLLLQSAWEWRGGVDIWVNNAGADVLTGELAEESFAKKLEVLWEVDVLGTIELSREIGQRMVTRGTGTVLNMGWDQADQGMEGDSGELFATVKGAVMAFTRSLARSLAPTVRVNCLAPGWIRTQWGQNASGYWHERACGEAILQRWGTPDDVARAARFLASPDASFITGHVLPINGGWAGRYLPDRSTR
ncbi:MAG: SDR family NAD(P)-dependent oxidoreductase [Planctomycetota bacterium]|nr:SDR family NAD(P)-dependent oxidoreductase [Planctomycetota bacterium]MDA1178996.1 SDR family NAD(P)-dependent oxidoreductase [Planctomycetota bacterium]